MTVSPNKPDTANPAMTFQWHFKSQWRRVADLERSVQTWRAQPL
jgi:hypothetical protein